MTDAFHERRQALRVFGGLAAGAAAVLSPGTARAQPVKWSSGSEPARTPAPPGAADCHHHIYDARYPFIPNAALKPGDATVADYRALQKRIGTTRHVIVQPSSYGIDNRLLVEALGQFGQATTRGVAVVNTEVKDEELKQLHAAGVRGIRFNLSPPGTTTLDMVRPLARRVAPMGWHVQVNAPASFLLDAKDIWSDLPCAVVFDHLAHVPEPDGAAHPAFAMVRALLQKDKAWVKLSGFYNDTKVGPPTYADSVALARAYVKEAPERLVWGSDWPHPTEKDDRKPNDATLFDLLADSVGDETLRQRILVDNAARLYQFG